MKQLPGFRYEPTPRCAFFDGYVAGTSGKVRRRRTIENVTRDQALNAWKTFREDLASGRAVEGPLTLRQFVERYYALISARHAAGTRKTQRLIISRSDCNAAENLLHTDHFVS
jgi:hypothetical protein